jgi:hypothetical protein
MVIIFNFFTCATVYIKNYINTINILDLLLLSDSWRSGEEKDVPWEALRVHPLA